MPAKINLLGQRFGRLLVRKEAKSNGYGAQWQCECDCGKKVLVAGCHLRHGTKSCGCAKRERLAALATARMKANTKHGHASRAKRSRAYNTWQGMNIRCSNPNFRQWKDYGGRGIKVCKRWRESFAAFLADMGEPPKNLTIDRIDNDGNYTPSNCRWETRRVQNLKAWETRKNGR